MRTVAEQSQRLKPAGRVSIAGACLFALLLIVGMEVQQHREDPPKPTLSTPFSPQLPEARLAAIQLGRPPVASDPAVARLAWLLDLLAADCFRDTRRDLAVLAIDSLGKLRASRIPATPAEVLGGVAGQPDIGRLAHCRPYFGRYVAERRHGAA